MQTSNSPFDGLPVEILRQIIAPLAKKDLKSLRETDRRLHTIVSEKLFESIAITPNYASYSQLLYIAASDFLSAQIQHLDWALIPQKLNSRTDTKHNIKQVLGDYDRAVGNTKMCILILQWPTPTMLASEKITECSNNLFLECFQSLLAKRDRATES